MRNTEVRATVSSEYDIFMKQRFSIQRKSKILNPAKVMGNSILAAVRVFTSHFYSHSIDPSSIFKFLMAQQPQLHCASGFICHGYPLDHSDQTDSKGPENLDGNSIGSLASRLQESGFNQLESSNINFNHRYENIFLDFFQPYILCQC